MDFIFNVTRFIRFIHPRRRNLGSECDTNQNRKYWKKVEFYCPSYLPLGAVLGVNGASVDWDGIAKLRSRGRAAGSPHIFSILDSTITLDKALTIVPLSSFVLIWSLRFTPQWVDDISKVSMVSTCKLVIIRVPSGGALCRDYARPYS